MKYPPELLSELKTLADRFELAIRSDERDRIISKMRGELFAEQTSQPLHESGLQPKDVVTVRLNSTQKKMLRFLEAGYIAVPTLAGNLRITKETVYTYLWQLEKMGYQIDRRNTGNHRGGYAKIYRLAKAA
jgi:biotin operon repressor